MNDSETQGGGLEELKSKKVLGKYAPDPVLEACAFGALSGNRSVFILDPRLVILVVFNFVVLNNFSYPLFSQFHYSLTSGREHWDILNGFPSARGTILLAIEHRKGVKQDISWTLRDTDDKISIK